MIVNDADDIFSKTLPTAVAKLKLNCWETLLRIDANLAIERLKFIVLAMLLEARSNLFIAVLIESDADAILSLADCTADAKLAVMLLIRLLRKDDALTPIRLKLAACETDLANTATLAADRFTLNCRLARRDMT